MTRGAGALLAVALALAGAPLAWGQVNPAGQSAPVSATPERAEGSGLSDGWLVTPSEARAFKGEEGFEEEPALRARAVVPLIDILKPEAASDLKVKSPFAIAVQFRGQSDTPIDPVTFKLMYGALKVDITQRVTRMVTVTKDGFTLDQAQFPSGKHRLTLQVQDSRQRVAERELRIEVE